VSRDRVINDDELKLILAHAFAEDSTFNNILLLLLLTGQRRNEIASLQSDGIDFKSKTITLPALVTKNKRPHTFPFGKMTEMILKKALEKAEKRVPENAKQDAPLLLFPARGKDTPFAGWSKAKPDFDKGCPVAHWTLHDLRRTCATNLAALGVPVHVTEKLLNHVSGTTSGIVAVYQRHAYIDEMREAIEAWEKRVRMISLKRARKSVESA
tara:strand:- start:6533 stop:7168 length:636 start_codon:yes stop_codon:yes gene_type:complete